MSMDTIFAVRNEDLSRFSPEEAVDVFRELLWAEATSIGIGKNLINVPSAIDVADGGVDAEVRDAPVGGGQGIIKQGLTRFQIKTGDFSLTADAHVREILFRADTSELKPRIKSCLDRGGTFVVVLFGWDNPEIRDNRITENFIRHLKAIDSKYEGAKIEVWRQNNVRAFLSTFPSLALRVTGRDKLRFQSHRSWSRQDDMAKDFKEGEPQRRFIDGLATELRRGGQAVHARVWGEPGIGKTRLVLEATSAKDLSPLVIYCDAASKFRDSDLMNELLKDDNHFSAVLVIDECDPDSRSYIWNKLKHCGERIKLASISSDFDATSGNIAYIEAPALEKQEVASIIETYGVSKDQAKRWSDLCSGSPRVAHVIGSNLRNNPEDILRPLDTVNVWDRYIVSGDVPESESVGQRRLVLRHLALFKRFGYGKPFVAEAQAIAKLVEQADRQITWSRFQEVVNYLAQRKLLQGETTLYITPKALHIRLWLDWWDNYGSSFDFNEFCQQIPPGLLEWYFEMFEYASGSPASAGVVRHLFGPGGPFSDTQFLTTDEGGSFFLKLSQADPQAALAYLSRTIGTWSKDELLAFTAGRREVVWALERIAVWDQLFGDAARLLLALGEAENEQAISNNASGVFISLFAIGPGPVASTAASFEDRLVVLKDALVSDSKDKRILAIKACNAALESRHWTRMGGIDEQGLRQRAKLWVPKTYGELYDDYRQVWQLLVASAVQPPSEAQSLAAEVLLGRARGLTLIPRLAGTVIETIRNFASKPQISKKQVLSHIIGILHYEHKNLPKEILDQWKQIRDELSGRDFGALLRRYVGMDLLEDKFDEQGNQVDQAQPLIESLAQQVIESSQLLQPELQWLTTAEAENGFRFGYELGKRDQGRQLLPALLDAQRDAGENQGLQFLGGYFRALREKDQKRWEGELDALCNDEQGKPWIPELTWRSGLLSDAAALRILGLVKARAVTAGQFRMFVFGGVIRGLTEAVFQQLIGHLLGEPEKEAISIALDLYTMFYKDRVPRLSLPRDPTFRLLTHDALFQTGQEMGRLYHEGHNWAAIGQGFLRDHPADALPLAGKILQHLGEDGTIVEGFHSQAHSLLNDIARMFPSEVWTLVAKYLGPPIDSRAFHIKEWLRGGDPFQTNGAGFLEIFPPERMWEWVDGDVAKRAWYLATLVPPSLFRAENRISLARELLVRYGDREDVRRNLMANFSSGGWSGLESTHHQGKRERLREFRQDETNERVRRWIDEYVSYLDRKIAHARMEEEREGD